MFVSIVQVWNRDSKRPVMIKAVLTAGLYANVAVGTDTAPLYTWKDATSEVRVHPSSVNRGLGSERKPTYPFMVYHEKMRTARVYLRDSSVVAPEALLLFGGNLEVQHANARVVMGGWMKFRCDAPVAVLFKYLRVALDADFAKRIQRTGKSRWADAAEEADDILVTIRRGLDDQ